MDLAKSVPLENITQLPTISTENTRLIELPNCWYLNGHRYKKDFTAEPFREWHDSALKGSLQAFFERSFPIENTYKMPSQNRLIKTRVKDNLDPSIEYLLERCVYTDLNVTAFFKLSSGEIFKAHTRNDAQNLDGIIGQSDTELFLISSNINNEAASIWTCNKNSLEITSRTSLTNGSISIIKETSAYIYLLCFYYGSSNMIALRRLNKATYAIENIGSAASTQTPYYAKQYSHGCIDINGKSIYFCYQNSNIAANTNAKPFTRYEFDFNTQNLSNTVVDQTLCNVDWNNLTNNFNIFPTHNYSYTYEMYTTAFNGKYYLHVIKYQMATTTANYSQYEGFYTFEIQNEGKDLLLIDYKNFANETIKCWFTTKNEKTLCIGTYNQTIYIHNWNDNSEKYELTGAIRGSAPIKYAALDAEEKLWFMEETGALKFVNLSVPTEMILKMERDIYEWQGSDIETSFDLMLYNYAGEAMSANVSLELSGNVVFTSNNQKQLEVIADTDEYINIPVTIKGDGEFAIYPTIHYGYKSGPIG